MPEVLKGENVKAVLTETEGAQKMFYRDVIKKNSDHVVGVTLNDVLPGGNSKDHFHPGFHVTYIVSGSGILKSGDEMIPITEGDVVYLTDNEAHCYINNGTEVLRLLGIK